MLMNIVSPLIGMMYGVFQITHIAFGAARPAFGMRKKKQTFFFLFQDRVSLCNNTGCPRSL